MSNILRRSWHLLLLLGVSFVGSSLALATPAFVQGAQSTTYASAQTAGNLNVVAVFTIPKTATVTGVSDSRGNTYVAVAGISTGTAAFSYRLDVFYAKNIVSAAGSENTVSVIGSGATISSVITAEYSGLDTSSPFDVKRAMVTNTGEDGEWTTGGLSTTNANDLLVGVFSTNIFGSPVGMPGSGYTSRVGLSTNRFLEDRVVTAAGTYSATAYSSTVRSGHAAIAAIIAFKAAPPDTQAPTAPTALSATTVSSSQINLSWTASTDNVGVTGYLVERCQGSGCSAFTQIGTTSATTFNDTGLSSGTSYSYRVRGQDAALNLSGYSNTTTVTTSPGVDTQAPTTPTGLMIVAASSNEIDIAWNTSTDNVGVTAYIVERCQSVSCSSWSVVATPAVTRFNDMSRSPSTSYSYRVSARDAANNISAPSASVTYVTPVSSPDCN